jgi:hypothetical protein
VADENIAQDLRIPAYAMLRACAAGDQEAALLLVEEAQRAGTLPNLVFGVAHLAARAMLDAEGWDTEKVLRVLDGWLDVAANGVPGPGQAA